MSTDEQTEGKHRQTPEMDEKRAKMLEHLAKAREKAAEKRRLIGNITKKEKEAKEKAFQERIKKIEMLEKADREDNIEDEEPKKTKHKKINKPVKDVQRTKLRKVIEISESSSDDETSEDSESEDDPVEYVVKRKPRSKPKATKTRQPKEYDTPRLTAEIAKDLLKQRVMSDAQKAAFESLFPMHRF